MELHQNILKAAKAALMKDQEVDSTGKALADAMMNLREGDWRVIDHQSRFVLIMVAN